MITADEFHLLDYQTQAARIERLGREALSDLGVEPTAVSLIQHAENTSYRVESPQGRFNLRVSRPGYQSVRNVWSEIEWLTALREAGFAVPEPYMSRLVVASAPGVPEPRTCVLFRWMEGEFHRGLTCPEAEAIGRLIAQLHEFVGSWAFPHGFERQEQHAWADNPARDPFDQPSPVLEENDRDTLRTVWEESVALVRSTPRTAESYGLIHADLHPGNLLFGGPVLGAIDFDDASFGFFMYDFAAALAYEPDERLREPMLRAYEEVRPLPPGARELLGPFIRLRLMNVSAWLVERTDNPKLQELAKTWIPQLCERIASTRQG